MKGNYLQQTSLVIVTVATSVGLVLMWFWGGSGKVNFEILSLTVTAERREWKNFAGGGSDGGLPRCGLLRVVLQQVIPSSALLIPSFIEEQTSLWKQLPLPIVNWRRHFLTVLVDPLSAPGVCENKLNQESRRDE